MHNSLSEAIANLASSVVDLLTAVFGLVVPWTPLAAWIAFWLFAVNWVTLRETLSKGGWIALVLIGAIMVLVWGSIAPDQGTFDFYGLKVSNFVEKAVYVSGLIVIMFLAGALQLSGCCSKCMQFEEPVQIAEHHGRDAGHGHDSGHGHDAGHH
ncbi:MAG: hypothetical protein HY290_07270 [Planctomycetia bacterium]|nr:hypothetical protein [Planctomycetia bacterium]